MEATKKLPLHDAHAEAGARFAPFAGYEMPVRYGAIKDEHHAVRQRVGLFDVSHMGEVFVRGRDAIAAVDRLVTNDCTRLVDGRALYTVMCRQDGGIVDDLIVYRLAEDEVLICVNAANRDKDFSWIREHIHGDVKVTDESDGWVQLAIQGPRAVDVVASVAGQHATGIGTYWSCSARVAGYDAIVARTGYTGEDGFEIYAPVAGARAVFDALVEAGGPHGMALCGLGARDTLRLEARYALYGNDIDESTNPIEAGLGWVVKTDAGDFVGRDALLRIKEKGPSRRLRGLILEDRGVIRRGYEVFCDGVHVGTTTSGGIAPTLDDISIGIAYIASEYADRPSVEIDIRGRRVPARLTTKPFYSRPKT